MNLKGNKKLLKYFILIISFLSGFVIIFNIYGYVLHQNNSNKSMEYLSEITKQTANSLNKRINDEFDKLKSMALLIGRQGNMDASKLMSVLKQEKDQNGYKKIGIALKDGSAYISDGKKENVKDDDFFKQALTGKTTLSDTFTDQSDHNPVNIYSTPIYNNGKIVGVLFTYENNNKFLNSLEVSLFGGQGSLYIVSDNGDYVFRTEKTSTATQQDGNLFSVIEKSQLDPQYNADMIKKRMSSNEGGMFLYGSKSQGRHLHYYPLNINGWYVFFSVPASAINQELHDIEIVVFCLNVVMLLICTAFMMYVVFAQNKSKQTIEKAKNRIEAITANIPGAVQRRKNDEFFSITYLSDGFYKMVEYTRSEIKELFDDKFINMIHQDDMNDVSKKILTKLKRGTKIEMQYRICTKNRGYIWVLDNCIITDSMTSEISNIDSVMVEITELKKIQEDQRISNERYRIVSEQSDSIIYEFNIQDKSIYYTSNYKKKFGYSPRTNNFPKSMIESDLIHPEDVERFISFYDEMTAGEKKYSESEFRIKNDQDEFIWLTVRASVIFDRNNCPIRIIGKMIDINDQKKRTQALQLKAEMDLHSGVYNKKTTEQLVEQYLMEGDEGLHNAMMIIDIDNFKLINDRFGHATGDQVISDVAYKLKEIMRSSDIIGRVGGDEFMIFIKSMSSEQAIFKKAKDICCMFKDIKIKAAPNYKVSGSVGISIYKKDGTTYHELYNKADLALYRSKNQGKDRFCFYNEKEDKRTFDCVESES